MEKNTETIQESRDMAVLTIAKKSLMDVNFTAWHVAHEAAEWQKKQDEDLIRELVSCIEHLEDGISKVATELGKPYPFFAKPLIEKANKHLNQ